MLRERASGGGKGLFVKSRKSRDETIDHREREPLRTTTSIICQPHCRQLIAPRQPNACYRNVIEDG